MGKVPQISFFSDILVSMRSAGEDCPRQAASTTTWDQFHKHFTSVAYNCSKEIQLIFIGLHATIKAEHTTSLQTKIIQLILFYFISAACDYLS